MFKYAAHLGSKVRCRGLASLLSWAQLRIFAVCSDTTSRALKNTLEYYFFILVIKALCVPAVNKVSGYCIKSLTALANKPPTMQIFPHSKFGINRSTGLKVVTKKFIFVQNNFLAITFKPVDRLIPNFECVKICMVGGLFANAKHLSQ